MVYEIAGLSIAVKSHEPYFHEYCKEYRACDQSKECHFSVSVPLEQIERERAQSSKPASAGYAELFCLYREICLRLPRYDRFLVHCSVVEYEGGAYAFLGRSGVGKSTHSALWLKHVQGAKMLNGDKPILQATEADILVHGTPMQGKEGKGYKGTVPLKGLCFLEQSPTNEWACLSRKEGVSRLFTQLLIPTDEEGAARTLELADALLTRVPAYLLRCDVSREAVKLSFEGMTGKELI